MMLLLIKYPDSFEERRLEIRTDTLEVELSGLSNTLEDALDGLALELRPPDLPGRPGCDLIDAQKFRLHELPERGIAYTAVFGCSAQGQDLRIR